MYDYVTQPFLVPLDAAVLGLRFHWTPLAGTVGANDYIELSPIALVIRGAGYDVALAPDDQAILTGQATIDPPSLTAAAGSSHDITVTGAVLGDLVEAISFSLDLQGVSLPAMCGPPVRYRRGSRMALRARRSRVRHRAGAGAPRERMTLAEYLRAEAARAFELGPADCVTFASDWVAVRRGVDPIAHCRGYRGEAAANALLAGGLPRLAGRALRRAGLRLTRAPQPGDVGLVVLGNLATCAIRTPRGWAVRMVDGLASLPPNSLRVIAAWSV